MKNMEISDQNKSTESANAEVPTSSQYFGNALLPDALLIPRWKVIADYPKNLYHVGDILNGGWRCEDLIYCDHDGPRWSHYPHLFQKLEWWEERKTGEIEYVKWMSLQPDKFYVTKVTEINGRRFKCDIDNSWATFTKDQDFPATEQEYLSYIEGLKK